MNKKLIVDIDTGVVVAFTNEAEFVSNGIKIDNDTIISIPVNGDGNFVENPYSIVEEYNGDITNKKPGRTKFEGGEVKDYTPNKIEDDPEVLRELLNEATALLLEAGVL